MVLFADNETGSEVGVVTLPIGEVGGSLCEIVDTVLEIAYRAGRRERRSGLAARDEHPRQTSALADVYSSADPVPL